MLNKINTQIKNKNKNIQLIGIIWGIKEYYLSNNLNLTYLCYKLTNSLFIRSNC